MNRSVKNSKETAYDRIQDLILGMDIKPGETITEVALSERLGIGRTPVREALKKLEQEGLVVTTNRRKRVYVLTVKELEEIFEIKSCLETRVAGQAANRCTAKDAKQLEKIMQDMKAAATTPTRSEEDEQKRLNAWMDADRRLHGKLFAMAGNGKIQHIVKNLDLQWQRLRLGVYTLEGRMQRSAGEHEAFIRAIINNDPSAAQSAMTEHLNNVRGELVKLFKMFHYPIQ